jgi:hypothetical protein
MENYGRAGNWCGACFGIIAFRLMLSSVWLDSRGLKSKPGASPAPGLLSINIVFRHFMILI